MRRASVVVVDNDPLAAAATCDVLAQLGCDCERASTRAEALAAVRAREPDLVLLELALPDFPEVVHELRHRAPYRGRLIAMTTSISDATRALASAACVDRLVTRPINCMTLERLFRPFAGSPRASEQRRQLRAVVIDDDLELALAIEYALTTLGHQARAVSNPLEGLDAVAKAACDIAFIDLAMPILDGWSVARAIRALEIAPQPRLIAVSARQGHDVRAMSFAAGFEDHLVKPISVSVLARLVGTPT